MSKETLFLINPISGGRAGNRLAQSLDRLLRDLGLRESCDTAFTTADGPLGAGRDIAGYRRVIAAGGDGTVAGIVQGLAALEKKPLLGIIPLGTGNDLARVAGCHQFFKRKGLRGLVEALLAGNARRLDVFSVNGELLFTNYCGIGLDAKISNDFNLKRRSPLVRAAAFCAGPRAAYPWFAAANVLFRMPQPLELAYEDGGVTRRLQLGAGARQVLVTAIPSYAAGARPTDGCLIDDGRFEVTVIQTLRQWLLLHLTRFFPVPLSRLLPPAHQFRTGELAVRFSGSTFFQADGELYPGFPREGTGLGIRRAAQVELIFV
jgi:diacylglycerol kinase (ATP)